MVLFFWNDTLLLKYLSLIWFLERSHFFSRHLCFAFFPAQRFLLDCVYVLSFCSGLTFRYKCFALSIYIVCSLNIRFVAFRVGSAPTLWFVPDLLALSYHITLGCLLSSFAWNLFAILIFSICSMISSTLPCVFLTQFFIIFNHFVFVLY